MVEETTTLIRCHAAEISIAMQQMTCSSLSSTDMALLV
jgi:hypothetical protein